MQCSTGLALAQPTPVSRDKSRIPYTSAYPTRPQLLLLVLLVLLVQLPDAVESRPQEEPQRLPSLQAAPCQAGAGAGAGFPSPGGSASHSPEAETYAFLSQFKVPKQTAVPEWSQDLFLMNNYTRSTCRTFSNLASIHAVWETVVPELSVKHKFLMHGILALSAFHLCHLRPAETKKFAALAILHQDLALSHFRPILSSIDEDNCEPAVCMAIVLSLIGISALSRPRESQSSPSGLHKSSFADILGVFSLTRGVAEVLAPAAVQIRASQIRFMFGAWTLDSYEDVRLPEEVQSRFDALKHEIVPSLVTDAPSNLAVCLTALEQLVIIYKDIQYNTTCPDDFERFGQRVPVELELGLILKWTTNVPAEFILLLRQHHTAALIILAHYVVTMMSLGERWFCKDWSENALQLIRGIIDPSGLPWLRWPEDRLRRQQEFWRSAMDTSSPSQRPKSGGSSLILDGYDKGKTTPLSE
ncbi:hypothetical protein FKW77_001289 [Venturia effusa]|uniref:Transcription factor domain-containing protein n=1 Tax=Venturia effusa TaxID=50376 RepID=A0A517LNC7_9PEZI|nr:hypothetical protein FKW77_001289 [Venturia effusa]